MTLPKTGFLLDASEGLRRTLEDLASEIDLKKGEVLFREGDSGDALFAVLAGRLEISVTSAEGRHLVFDVMRPGALFGEIALFDPGPRTATVTALERATLARLKNTDLKRAIRDQPDLGTDLLRLAGRRMRWMSAQIGDQVFLPLPTRLARKVLYLSAGTSGENPERLRISQAKLAEFVGATREAVSKTLGDWKRAGIVDPVRGGLDILDPTALTNLAGIHMS